MNNYQEIAKTIFRQIGGGKVGVMIGGTFTSGHNSVTNPDKAYLKVDFKARAKKAIKSFIIYYNEGEDLYEVEFWKSTKSHKAMVKYMEDPQSLVVETHKGVFVEDLIPLIERTLGLALHL